MQKNLNVNKLLDFSQFLNEAEENSEINLLILSGTEGVSKTSESFLEECKKRSIECNVVNVDNITMDKLYNGHLILDSDEGSPEIIINPKNTVIVPRRGVVKNSKTKQIMRELEKGRYFCVNSLSSIEACENKYLTSVILENEKLPIPRYAIVSDVSNLDDGLKKIGGEFPVIMKLLSGSQGIGVSIVDSYASLKSVYQTITKLSPESEILLQEKIDSNYDIRVQIIVKKFNPLSLNSADNCEVVGVMKREAVDKDFRTNYSLGGEVKGFELTDEIKKIACKAANVMGCHWCGVDIMIDKKSENPYILEVNSSPGTEGISKVMDEPVVNTIIDYVSDKGNWTYTEMEVGYLETVAISGIGNLVAKFDTGNGSTSCTIHADEIEVKDEILHWTVGEVKMESPIVGYSTAEVGRDRSERPIVEVSFNIGDAHMDKVKVSPVDRTEKSTPFLVNRKLMRDLGLTVNPHKAFIISDKPKSGFSPKHSRGDRKAGIEFSKDSEEKSDI